MTDLNLKLNNNATVAKFIFDEVALWQSDKNPSRNLSAFINDLENLLDKIEEKGYNKQSYRR